MADSFQIWDLSRHHPPFHLVLAEKAWMACRVWWEISTRLLSLFSLAEPDCQWPWPPARRNSRAS